LSIFIFIALIQENTATFFSYVLAIIRLYNTKRQKMYKMDTLYNEMCALSFKLTHFILYV